MTYSFRAKRHFMSGENVQEMSIGSTEKDWENNTKDGAIPDSNLYKALYEDENDGVELNDEDRCFDQI